MTSDHAQQPSSLDASNTLHFLSDTLIDLTIVCGYTINTLIGSGRTKNAFLHYFAFPEGPSGYITLAAFLLTSLYEKQHT